MNGTEQSDSPIVPRKRPVQETAVLYALAERCERAGHVTSAFWHESDAQEGAELFRSAPTVQTSTCSAMARASSTSIPR